MGFGALGKERSSVINMHVTYTSMQLTKGVAKDLGSEGETTIKNMNRQSLPQLAGSRCKVDFRDLPSLRQRHLPQVEEAQQFSLRLLQRMLASSDYAKKQAEDVQTS